MNTNKNIKRNLRCKHYKNNFSIQCPECEGFYKCHICHDEDLKNRCSSILGETKNEISVYKCRNCLKIQNKEESNGKCIKCGIKWGKNYCFKCNIGTTKNIFHCYECGFCRLGFRKDFEHCNDCGLCMAVGHQCHKKNHKESICCICSENIFTTREEILILDCSHVGHRDCIIKWCGERINKFLAPSCPICSKTVNYYDKYKEMMMVQLENINEKVGDKLLDFQCNDCFEKFKEYQYTRNICPKCDFINVSAV